MLQIDAGRGSVDKRIEKTAYGAAIRPDTDGCVGVLCAAVFGVYGTGWVIGL